MCINVSECVWMRMTVWMWMDVGTVGVGQCTGNACGCVWMCVDVCGCGASWCVEELY